VTSCDHLRVNIRAIERRYNGKSRLLRGNCQDCGKEVRREQTSLEIATGKQETNWR
jgi:hypothetical protein